MKPKAVATLIVGLGFTYFVFMKLSHIYYMEIWVLPVMLLLIVTIYLTIKNNVSDEDTELFNQNIQTQNCPECNNNMVIGKLLVNNLWWKKTGYRTFFEPRKKSMF